MSDTKWYMEIDNGTPGYMIWGVDNVVYGPVDLPTLIAWVKDERVTTNTWIYLQAEGCWQQAQNIDQLRMFLAPTTASAGKSLSLPTKAGPGITINPSTLRRVRILAGLTDEQLQRFLELMEPQHASQWDEIVKEGSPGDAMYLLLEGEVRVRLIIAGKESILATLCAGEFFGEVALFDHGPRSADVVANTNCVLLRIPTAAFQKLVQQVPELAAPFLYAIGRTLISRIRADNKRYRDSIAFARTVHR
jgi:CRP/FNR family transcriptional regulator, cyclic AMP receptor protein